MVHRHRVLAVAVAIAAGVFPCVSAGRTANLPAAAAHAHQVIAPVLTRHTLATGETALPDPGEVRSVTKIQFGRLSTVELHVTAGTVRSGDTDRNPHFRFPAQVAPGTVQTLEQGVWRTRTLGSAHSVTRIG